FEVIDPATGEPFAEAPEATREQLDEAVAAARRAFAGWSQTSLEERKRVLTDITAAIKPKIPELADLLVREQGKPRDRASSEAAGAMTWFRVTAGYDLPVEVVRDDEGGRIEVRRRPIGVVGGITPWNFPLILATWKIAPALLTGNTIVLKPSPYTPLTTLVLGELIREVVPPGVVNIVSGGDELGRWMTTHPGIDKISFTGSVETGKAIMAAVAPDLKRLTLELGGNDAGIVLPDVDVEQAAPRIFEAAFGNTGQVCSALKRLYVHEDVYDPMCEALVELARKAKVGPGSEEGVDFGPLNNEMQLRKVIDLVEDAKAHGARVLVGGERMDRPG
ncbi:MAG: aldehyde dehydrogenase family protein, partial [Deltaproteobacteria bacterium]